MNRKTNIVACDLNSPGMASVTEELDLNAGLQGDWTEDTRRVYFGSN